MKTDDRVRAFNATKGRCAVCAAPLAFLEYGNTEVETGWVLMMLDAPTVICARCVKVAERMRPGR